MNNNKLNVFSRRSMQDENIYLNVNIFNKTPNEMLGTTNVTSTQYIIDKANDYYLSLLEFTLPERSLKILTFKPDVWSVTLIYNGIPYRAFLTLPANRANNPEIFAYQEFLNIINDAFVTAFNNLLSDYPFLAPSFIPPQMVIDTPSGLCSLFVNATYDPFFIFPDNTIQVCINSNLFSLFSHSFTVDFRGFNRPDGDDFKFIINDWVTNRYEPDPPDKNAGTGYYKIKQQINTLSLWYDFYSILIVSDNLPIGNQYLTLDDNPILKTQKIIFSYSPVKDNPLTINKFKYVNEGEYRLIDLKGEESINKISIRIVVIDKTGVLKNYMIPPNNSVNVKLAFFKKKDIE